MKALAILGSTVAGVLLLISSDDASHLPSPAQPNKGGAPPQIIHRSPAIGGAVRTPVVTPPVVVRTPTPLVVHRTPTIVAAPRSAVIVQQPIRPVVKENVNVFVNKNINKFVGPTGKGPPARVVERPKIEIGGKGAIH